MKKVLLYHTFDSGRDVEMLIPLRFFAEEYLKCEFYLANIYDQFQIYLINPDIIIVPNSVGSKELFLIAKRANQFNIPLFSLVSEGNLKLDYNYNYLGWNTDNTLYEDYWCCWSERMRSFLRERYPHLRSKFKVTGGLGYDRFKIYKFISQEQYLHKINKTKFKKVIVYPCWGFGNLNHPIGRRNLEQFVKGEVENLIVLEKTRGDLNVVLKEIVETHSDVLFVLKKHPTEFSRKMGGSENEIEGLEGFDNVYIADRHEKIDDLINVADIVLSYESTTAIEAWALDKTTVIIRPEGSYDEVLKELKLDISQVVVTNSTELDGKIREFYLNGSIKSFQTTEKIEARKEIIVNSFGWDDGKNHLRSAKYFIKTWERSFNNKTSIKFNLVDFSFHIGLWVFSKIYKATPILRSKWKFYKFAWLLNSYKLKNVDKEYQRRYNELKNWYAENRIPSTLEELKLFLNKV